MSENNRFLQAQENNLSLPQNTEKTCALMHFTKALEFVNEHEVFRTLDLHKYLRCGYHSVCQVLDALMALCVIELVEEKPRRFKRLIKNTNNA